MTEDIWAAHFDLDATALRPKPGDRDAEYTAEAYDMNDPRKIAMRENRQEAISLAIEYLVNYEATITQLLEAAEEDLSSADRTAHERGYREIELARSLFNGSQNARRTLDRWSAIPTDAPRACSCTQTGGRRLPVVLELQLVEIVTE
jgi:hypothetical protein